MTKLLAVFILCVAAQSWAHGNWATQSRASANLAPLPEKEWAAVVQAYAAPVWGWRGFFADHTWIAAKAPGADAYTVYEVIGWRLRRGLSAVRIEQDIPDRHWYGKRPRLLLDIRGAKAQPLLAAISAAAADYPYADQYRAFPGPNSNTFTAWIAVKVPALGLDLPLRAIGKTFVRNAL